MYQELGRPRRLSCCWLSRWPGTTIRAGYIRGPGRIICKSAPTCVVGIGTPATLKFLVNVEALPAEDKDRLTRQCKPTGKAMCIVTVQGTEMGDPMKIKATKITWHN